VGTGWVGRIEFATPIEMIEEVTIAPREIIERNWFHVAAGPAAAETFAGTAGGSPRFLVVGRPALDRKRSRLGLEGNCQL
jgi:hypothetical protein